MTPHPFIHPGCPFCSPLPCVLDLWLGASPLTTPNPLAIQDALMTRILNRFYRTWAPTLENLLSSLNLASIKRRKMHPYPTLKIIPAATRDLLHLLSPLQNGGDVPGGLLLETLMEWVARESTQNILYVLEALKFVGAGFMAQSYRPSLHRQLARYLKNPGPETDLDRFSFLLVLEATEESWRSVLFNELYHGLFNAFATTHRDRIETILQVDPDLLPDDMVLEFLRLPVSPHLINEYTALYRSMLNHIGLCTVINSNLTGDEEPAVPPLCRFVNGTVEFDDRWMTLETRRRQFRLACLQWLKTHEASNSVWIVLDWMGVTGLEAWEPVLNVQFSVLATLNRGRPLKNEDTIMALLIMGNVLILFEVLADILTLHYAPAVALEPPLTRAAQPIA